MWQVYHPLLRRAAADRASLVARSDAEAQALWAAAGRLAAWRIARQRAAQEAISETLDEPWGGESQSWQPPPEALTPSDMARALMALQPALIQARVLPDEHGEQLLQANTTWAARLEQDAGPPPPLDRYWARRWAMASQRAPLSLTASTLLENLSTPGLAALAAFHQQWREGLLLWSETMNKVLHNLAEAELHPVTEALPAAWLERGGLMAAVDAGLRSGPGVVALRAPGGARQSLLAAWSSRHGAGDVPEPLRSTALVSSYIPYCQPPGGWRARATSSNDWILMLTDPAVGSIVDQSPTPYWAPGSLARLSELCEADDDSRPRLLIETTPARWSALVAQLPALAGLAVLEHPPLSDVELLPAWLCQRPALEDHARAPFGLFELLSHLHGLEPAARRQLPTIATLRLAPSHARLIPPRRALQKGDHPRALQQLHKRAPWTAPLIPDAAHLRALLDLAGQLNLPPGSASIPA